jgi:hypothetical protein
MSSTHYVNNSDLLNALIKHRKEITKAKKEKRTPPCLSDYIGLCFFKIAEHLSRKANFSSYTFREDMISDAVENCIQYVHNFNPSISRNPFGYFTKIIYWAFLRRISREKTQLYVKYKATEQLGLLQHSNMHETDEVRPFQVYENISDFIHTFEAKREAKSRKKVKVKMSSTYGTLRFIGDL